MSDEIVNHNYKMYASTHFYRAMTIQCTRAWLPELMSRFVECACLLTHLCVTIRTFWDERYIRLNE